MEQTTQLEGRCFECDAPIHSGVLDAAKRGLCHVCFAMIDSVSHTAAETFNESPEPDTEC